MEEKMQVLTKENAAKVFEKIVDAFNFNVSTEVKEKIFRANVANVDMQFVNEVNEADAFVSKIMSGKIEFDDEKNQIAYILNRAIKTDDGIVHSDIRFGRFTRAMQKNCKVTLEKCNFATMKDDERDSVLCAMTGNTVELLNELDITEFSDLCMIGGYFFS